MLIRLNLLPTACSVIVNVCLLVFLYQFRFVWRIICDREGGLFQVNSPHGHSYHYESRVESGNFAFTGIESGNYKACFWAPDHKPPVTVVVDFDWRIGLAAKDWSNVAKKGQIEVGSLISLC